MSIALLFASPPPPGIAVPVLVGGQGVLDRQLRQVRLAGGAAIVADEGGLDPARLDGDVLVVDRGVVLDDRIVRAMRGATAPAVAVWPAALGRGTERIDLHDMAAGIALYPAALVRDTVKTLGDWELAPTLLRSALAAGATRVDLTTLPEFDAELGREVPLVWARPDDADSAGLATDRLLAAAEPGGRDWIGRWLHRPVVDAAARLLLPLPVTAEAVAAAGLVIALVAGVAFASGWLATGLLLAILFGPAASVAAKLARVRIERLRWPRPLVDAVPYGWFAAVAAHFAATHAPAAWPLAALLIGFMLAENVQRGFYRQMTGTPLDAAGRVEQRLGLFAARRDTLLWTWLPFAAIGEWTTGFAVLAAYATASFFAAQWRTFARLAERR